MRSHVNPFFPGDLVHLNRSYDVSPKPYTSVFVVVERVVPEIKDYAVENRTSYMFINRVRVLTEHGIKLFYIHQLKMVQRANTVSL